MGWIKLNGFVLLLVISESLAGLNVLSAVSNFTTRPLEKIAGTDRKGFMQIAAENGYNAEKHEVITSDGYILTMFRIPPHRNCAKKSPLLMMHGVLQTSECFIVSGPESPGFVLAQEYYDIWFGNVRGNVHSRRHVTLNPDKDLEFWKFSADEMGLYDIPAMVDYVLHATDTKKLIYLGYSQGGGTFFIMNSAKPEYADKITLFIALAPATRLYYTRSVAFRTLTIAINSLQTLLEAAGVWEILSEGFPLQGALNILCQIKLLAEIACGLALTVIDSPSRPESITPEIERRIFETFLFGTSVQNLARYGQAYKEKFTKIDYGSKHNIEIYGSTDPPEYNLNATTMPVVLFSGKMDHLVDTKDVKWVAEQLPNVLANIIVDDPLWNHVDTCYSRYWRDSIFDKMKKYLVQYDDITVGK